MQKDFCDKCGAECAGYRLILSGTILHRTTGGDQVGCDEIKHRDLCRTCAGTLIETYGLTVIGGDPGPDSQPLHYEPQPMLRAHP